MELKQRRLWDTRQFKLLDKEVWFRSKTPTQDVEMKIRYEDLGLETVFVRKKEASIVFAVLMLLSAAAGSFVFRHADIRDAAEVILVGFVGTVIFSIQVLIWAETRKPLIIISGGKKTFTLLAQSPSQREVALFVAALHERIRSRIIEVRVRPKNTEWPIAYKKSVLDALLDEHVIDQEKYDGMLDEIQKMQSPQPNVGFNRVSGPQDDATAG
ncbi:MAG: hypothetical protein NW241_04210 [Bacteroidia bacterium]|nr:hypothetical protein [Bacteroidia bacterium]